MGLVESDMVFTIYPFLLPHGHLLSTSPARLKVQRNRECHCRLARPFNKAYNPQESTIGASQVNSVGEVVCTKAVLLYTRTWTIERTHQLCTFVLSLLVLVPKYTINYCI